MNPQVQILLQQAIQAFQNNNFERAESILKKILQLDLKNLVALQILGLIKVSQQNFRDAITYLSRAEKLNPSDVSIQYNLAKVLSDCGSYEESIRHHQKTIELAPNHQEAWLNYGKSLVHLSRYEEAIFCFEKTIYLNPEFAEAHMNKGAALKELHKYGEAVAAAEKALQINANLAEAWVNRAIALKELKCYKDSIASYQNALALKPNIDWIYGDLLFLMLKISDLSNFWNAKNRIEEGILRNEKIIQPFVSLAITESPELQYQSAKIYSQDNYPSNLILGSFVKKSKQEKICIGYFSADFYNHATGYLIAQLIELHDRSQFDLIAISFGPDVDDAMSQRLMEAFDSFINVRDKSDFEIAKLSRKLNIDIAIDLKGYTQDCRPGIFSFRAAPIQANYLGYPGTTGSAQIDYIIADKAIIPEPSQKFYTEKVVYLPNCYQVNDSKRPLPNKKFLRSELGLPESGFIFCSFNNNYKILPETLDSWARILEAVELSILWLLTDSSVTTDNIKKEFSKRGIDPKRLVFADKVGSYDHLARHYLADLFLDTWPCNAHTTASDALWMGLPLVTLIGHSFAGRVAASLLNTIGLPELITNTQEQYEELAIQLAQNPQILQDIKRKLDENRMTSPLFDTHRFTKNLENAYIKMYERYRADLDPVHLYVD